MFGAAGTWDWPGGWTFLVVNTVYAQLVHWVADPDLMAERSSLRKGIKRWDVVMVCWLFFFLYPIPLIVAGLDVKRFGWSPALPGAIQISFLLVFILSCAFGLWTIRENPFYSMIIRIQCERGHTVVKTGPYAYIRHPGYAFGILGMLSAPLALGSLWALMPAVAGMILVIVRTGLEDRVLQRELPGYREYARDVGRRLLPGVW